MLNMTKLLFFVISILSPAIAVNLKVLYEWKYVDFVWDNPWQKQWALKKGYYNVSSCVLFDVDKAPDGRIFVTSVRQEGVPASLMTISKKKGAGGPLLRPYPDWSWYRNDGCQGITSVYRVFIKCNHLIVLDNGKVGEKKVCPAQLLIFELWNDRLVKRVKIPDHVATNKTGSGLLTTPTVTSPGCSNFLHNMMVFMSDTEGYGLVVYNARFSTFCRIESQSMRPSDTNFTIDGQSFSLDDGILGLTVVNKDLYYAPLSSTSMYRLDAAKIGKCLLNKAQIDQDIQLMGKLSGQTGPIASQCGTIFFSDMPRTSILCANASKRIDSSNSDVIAQDPVKLQFPSGLKVIERTRDHDSSLMIMTNRYQRVTTNTLNLKETNFRILSMSMAEIKSQTHCFHSQ